jgi:outer membrane protein TolC
MKSLFTALLLLQLNLSIGQQNSFTLPQLIAQAQQNSLTQKIAAANNELALLDYKSFLLQRKPNLILNGNVPVYDKDNFSVRQPDGTIKFLNRSQINSSINLGFVKPILATGGSISVNTSLNRFDDLLGKTQLYNGTPIYLQLQQPIFAFNNYKWQKKTVPLKLVNATLEFTQKKYDIGYTIATYFFTIVTNTIEKELALENEVYTQENIKAEERKKQLGVGNNDKLIQLSIQALNNKQQLQNITLQINTAQKELFNAAQLTTQSNFNIVIPTELLNITITTEALLDSIKKNNPDYDNLKIAAIELQAEKEKLQKEKTTINLTLSYGLNQSGNVLRNVYQIPNDQQRFNIGFTVPLTDGGRRKNIGQQILVKQKLLQLQQQEQNNQFEVEVENSLTILNNIKNSYTTALQLDSLGKERYNISNKLFSNGKLTILELNAAALERANYKRSLFNLVKEYYLLYYKLQQTCACILQ